jgi:hypothetical protein
MRRRDFIALLGGAAAARPLAAQAQQGERMRRIGALIGSTADDPDAQVRYAAFLQGLQQLGWTDGRNVRIDIKPAGHSVCACDADPQNIHDPEYLRMIEWLLQTCTSLMQSERRPWDKALSDVTTER